MKKLPKLVTIMLYIVGITFILSLIIIRYFSTKLEPALKYYLSTEVKRVLSLVINDTISNTTNNIDINNIIVTNNNSNTIDINTKYNTFVHNTASSKSFPIASLRIFPLRSKCLFLGCIRYSYIVSNV